MKHYIISFLLLLLLTGCGAELSLEIDEEQTRIIDAEEFGLLSVNVRIVNTSSASGEDLYAKFIIENEEIQKAIGEQEVLFTNSDGLPDRFTIKPESAYFVAEAFVLVEDYNKDDLPSSISVEIYNHKDEKLLDYTIENVTTE